MKDTVNIRSVFWYSTNTRILLAIKKHQGRKSTFHSKQEGAYVPVAGCQQPSWSQYSMGQREHNTNLVQNENSYNSTVSLQARMTNFAIEFPTLARVCAHSRCQQCVTCHRHHIWQARECRVSSNSVKARCSIINVDNISDKQRGFCH